MMEAFERLTEARERRENIHIGPAAQKDGHKS
jgi:hypothetical protein